MAREFEGRILGPAPLWGPVTGVVTGVVGLGLPSGMTDGVEALTTIVVWSLPIGAVLGLLCAIPVALVVAMTTGGRPPREARRRGFASGGAAAAMVTAVLTTLVGGWAAPWWATWVVLVTFVVAGWSMGHASARIARPGPAAVLPEPSAATSGQ